MKPITKSIVLKAEKNDRGLPLRKTISPMRTRLLITIGLILLAIALITTGVLFYQSIPFVKFRKIRTTMSLSEVEAVLGPGEKISRSSLPLVPPYVKAKVNGECAPVIDGDEFWFWSAKRLGWHTTIYIGFRNGKVCDKTIDVDAL